MWCVLSRDIMNEVEVGESGGGGGREDDETLFGSDEGNTNSNNKAHTVCTDSVVELCTFQDNIASLLILSMHAQQGLQ